MKIELSIQTRAQRDEAINWAITMVIPFAVQRRCGITVTRASSSSFIVEAASEVPFGETLERWLDDSPAAS